MAVLIQLRRDTQDNFISANKIHQEGEFSYETDTGYLKIGNGIQSYTGLPYWQPQAVIDNLTSQIATQPLSASQGFVLKGLIDNINSLLLSDNSTLDTIQEIVDFIEINKSTLDTLGISSIAGLQNALDLKVDKVAGKELSDNNFTDILKTAVELNKLKDLTLDPALNLVTLYYTDGTTAEKDFNDVVNDIYVNGATLDATTNVLTFTSADGGENVTVDLSDFVNSSELTTELNKKADLNGATFTGNVTAPTLRVKDDASDTSAHRVTVYDDGTTSYGMILWNTDGTSGDWATTLYAPNQSNRRISFARISADSFTTHSDLTEFAYFDCDDDTFHLKNGDVILEKASTGVVMKSPNGTSYKLTVNDDGSLQTTEI